MANRKKKRKPKNSNEQNNQQSSSLKLTENKVALIGLGTAFFTMITTIVKFFSQLF
ncbi:hypothetical protein [Acinetobacter sp. WCHAc060025]|uniref:hypothetical protein n=1 Tax=Acinetobacter sp. WCHAc060025 TaxID=2518625 RepID=UPI0013EE519C|nr:hypothetical protein [Acinetobacter sp. WCHAc060025]